VRQHVYISSSFLEGYQDYDYYYDTSLNQIDYWEFIGKQVVNNF
jgi:hypothetical protein